jgi:hypothetical protein
LYEAKSGQLRAAKDRTDLLLQLDPVNRDYARLAASLQGAAAR